MSTRVEPTVLVEQRGSVALVTLNRPATLNAWNRELEEAYFDALDAAERDPEVRAIVVTGAGRGFCAGADLGDLEDLIAPDRPPGAGAGSRPRSLPYGLRTPLIGAINGAVAGLGLVQALYCDVRFVTPEAKITTAFSRRGLTAEYGITWILPRLVGTARALDLLLSGRVISGADAHAMGLAEHVHPREQIVDAALAYATELATLCSPMSMAVIKAQVRADADRPFAASYMDAERLTEQALDGPDFGEGIRSHLERRAPAFPGLGPGTPANGHIELPPSTGSTTPVT